MFLTSIQQNSGCILLWQLLITPPQNNDPMMFVLIMPIPRTVTLWWFIGQLMWSYLPSLWTPQAKATSPHMTSWPALILTNNQTSGEGESPLPLTCSCVLYHTLISEFQTISFPQHVIECVSDRWRQDNIWIHTACWCVTKKKKETEEEEEEDGESVQCDSHRLNSCIQFHTHHVLH